MDTESENETSHGVPDTYRLGSWLWREDWPLWLLISMAAAFAVWKYPTLPDRIPIHWNLRGQPDNWSNRAFGTFGTLGIAVGTYALLVLLPLIDPRRTNYRRFLPTLRILRWSLALVGLTAWGIALAVASGVTLPVDRAIPVVVSILFIVLGNVLGRVRQNWFIGIRTPWSLSSEEAWRLTHRVAGPAWVLGGIVSFAGALVGGVYAGVAMLVGIGGAAAFSIAYSYFAYRRVMRSGPPNP